MGDIAPVDRSPAPGGRAVARAAPAKAKAKARRTPSARRAAHRAKSGR
jgi:hypothetical protein